ncbi:hypothetical protein GOBAR_DD11003 [Gossypium barbadense]|nr:hypothetical protein GOBAR_DD11003 [Gossypium barbadense]
MYESKGIYLACANKIKDNEDRIGLHEPLLLNVSSQITIILAFQLLQALTYEGTEQVNVEEPDASTKEIISYEYIENVDTCNSSKVGMRIPEEQFHMTEPFNNMYMPNPATALAPKVTETTGYIIEATLVSTLPPKAQAPTSKRRCIKKYRYKERNITLLLLLELLTYGETGEQNEELEASTMKRTNFENMHMSNLIASASTAPKGRCRRKRKMKKMVSSKAKANIGVEQNDEAASIVVPINDEAALINVAIIDEAALIDVPITYVENFSDLGR